MESNQVELQSIRFTERGNTDPNTPPSYDNIGLEIEEGGIRSRKVAKNTPEKVEKQDDENDDDDSSDDDDDEDLGNAWSRSVKKIQTMIYSACKTHSAVIWTFIYIVLTCGYMTYFSYCMYFRFGDEGSIRLLVCTILAVLLIVWNLLSKCCGDKISLSAAIDKMDPETRDKIGFRLNIAASVLLAIGAVIYIIAEIAVKTPRNLISLAGMAFFIASFYVFSYNPARVNWRPVFWGLILQFYFALLILRWDFGYRAFEWLGERVREFLAYTDEGSKFVFGEDYEHHFFAFKVLTVIVFFSTVISVLYHIGVMQFIIRNLARFMAIVMDTSPAESLNAAGNIFIGQSEAPLMIRPFLPVMTKSELHAICSGGFATIAGSIMAAYILFNVPANHLLSASVMSAPAALAMSKLFYPETKKSKASAKQVYNMQSSGYRNIIEAASVGASQSIKLIANITVNLIAFIALLEFVNQTLVWFGNRAGMEKPGKELTFQLICSYVFWPLPFLMGVETEDCYKVAELIGLKTFLNEFYAYTQLSVHINNQMNLTWYENLPFNESIVNNNFTGTWVYEDEHIVYNDFEHKLIGGVLADRSVVIATYALCGFSNIGSIGIMLGALGAMAPSQTRALSTLIVRAMIAGNVACFLTACIAGLLYIPGK